jgi:hypothetical protein
LQFVSYQLYLYDSLMSRPHVTPCHLQKWVELFQEFNTPNGSLDIDSLNLSNAEWSVLFPKAEADLFRKFKVKRRNKTMHRADLKRRNNNMVVELKLLKL